jgi:transcriptional regulator with XRE-family HTH domain
MAEFNHPPMKQLLKALGVSQKQLAYTIGISPNAISQYASGTRRVTEKTALAVSYHYPNINSRWLLTGEGSMLVDPALPADATDAPYPARRARTTADLSPEEIEQIKAENEELQRQILALKAEIYDMLKAKESNGPKANGDPPGIVSAGY